jgi:predicted RNA polymerase sigma factor
MRDFFRSLTGRVVLVTAATAVIAVIVTALVAVPVAVRAHLLEQAGFRGEARAAFERAARLTTRVPEQRYLSRKALTLPEHPLRCPNTEHPRRRA